MGCDIHFYVETLKDGCWQSADRWSPDEYADDPANSPPRVRYEDQLYTDRNYDLFGILADVRNGRGFAGCDLGDGFVPISDPRGLPEDVSDPIKVEAESYGADGHSHSYLTVAELLAYDWTQVTKHRGWVDALHFWKWSLWDRRKGESPKSWCGDVGGGIVQHITIDAMDAIAAEATAIRKNSSYEAAEAWLKENHAHTYTQAEWSQPYYKSVRSFLSDTMPRLWQLGKPEEVRIVFWFDN